MGTPGQFSLNDFTRGMQQGQQLQSNQMLLSEQAREMADAAAVRQAYAQQYGGGAPAGLAGVQPTQPGTPPPVQERQLGGAPTSDFHGAQPPPGGPQAPQGLAGAMGGAAQGPMTPQDRQGQRAFINTLYTLSPKAGREAETHAYTTQKHQMEANKERVEYLGRIANGVLESDNPQQAWEVARAMLLEAGMPPSQMPPVYDPNYVQQLSAMARTATERYNEGMLRLQQHKEQRESNLAASKAPQYGYGNDLDAAIYARYGTQLPPGSPPTPAMVQQARQDLLTEERQIEQEKQQGRVEVAAATGREAAQEKALGQTAQKRLEDYDKAGLEAQTAHTTMDEIERLIGEGVYGNTIGDRAAMAAYRAGTRPHDAKAQRTARLQELGSKMTAAPGLGTAVSDADAKLYAKAAGNFQEPKNLQEMRESLKSMRAIANTAVKTANRAREHYEQTGKLPPFEARALSEQDITDTIAAGKAAGQTITRQQVIEAARSKGYDVPER